MTKKIYTEYLWKLLMEREDFANKLENNYYASYKSSCILDNFSKELIFMVH